MLHLNGRAESWFLSYQLSKGIVRWKNYVEKICKSFNDSYNSNLNLLGKTKRVEQKGTLTEYLEKLEDLKAWVFIKYPTISIDFLL